MGRAMTTEVPPSQTIDPLATEVPAQAAPAPTTAAAPTGQADGTPTVPTPPANPSPNGRLDAGDVDTWGGIDDPDIRLPDGPLAAVFAQVQQQQQTPAPAPAPVAVPVVAEPPAPVAPPVVPADDLNAPVLPGQQPNNIKVPVKGDEVALRALSIYKDRQLNGNPIGLDDAVVLARQVLGKPAATAPTTPPDTSPAPAPAEVQTPVLSALEAERDQLLQEFEAAENQFDSARRREIQARLNEIATLRGAEIALSRYREEQGKASQEAAAEQRWIADWNTSLEATAKGLPQLRDPNSALHQRTIEMQNEAVTNPAHPLHHIAQQGNSAAFFAMQAANELNVQPTVVVSQPVSSTSTPQVPPQVSAPRPPIAAIISGGGGMPPSASLSPSRSILDQMSDADYQRIALQARYPQASGEIGVV